MRYEFHPEALTEYEVATRYYADRDPRVAERFIAAVEDALERILDSPTRWRIMDEDVRRCLTHVFPYGVLYTIEADFILVVAVLHFSREPSYWKARRKAEQAAAADAGRGAERTTGGRGERPARLNAMRSATWSSQRERQYPGLRLV